MKRRLFNFATLLSLLLCLATAGLWGRSYWEGYELGYQARPPDPPVFTWTYVARGAVWLGRIDSYDFPPQGWSVGRVENPAAPRYAYQFPLRPSLGFGLTPRTTPQRMYGIVIPLWFVFLPLAVLPTRWAILKHRETKRKRTGCCKVCGYDLRATPARCPECGTVAEIKT